jgi:2-dehydropantoate 2-reductase
VRPLCVYGAGALGSVLGALLSPHTRVQVIGRAAHVDAIHRQGGLRVSGHRAGLYPLEATTNLQVAEQAIVLVTVKAFDLEAALQELAPGLDESHLVVVLQNGLGIRDLATRVLGRPVVRAVTFTAASFEEPGHVALNALGKTYFPAQKELVQLWERGAIPCEQVDDMGTYEWRKLAINAVINPLSALLGVRNGELRRLRQTTRELVQELIPVAHAEGIALDLDETYSKVMASMEQTGSNRSSMLQDVRSHRLTEIEWINGAVVRLARKHGVPVVRHQQLLELVHFVEQHSSRASGTPAALS